MLEKFLSTDQSFILTVARVCLGLVMIPHGLQKIAGLFGGYGWAATIKYFSSLGFPVAITVLVMAAESLGALGLLAGFCTRFCAFAIGLTMLGAAIFVRANGFFMNWTGQQAGEGFEYHILAIALAFILTVTGGGAFSADGYIADSMK